MDEEAIVYADIDLEKSLIPKIRHDVVGHYNRFDIMWLGLNRSQNKPIVEMIEPVPAYHHKMSEEDFFNRLQGFLDGMENSETRSQIQELITAYRKN